MKGKGNDIVCTYVPIGKKKYKTDREMAHVHLIETAEKKKGCCNAIIKGRPRGRMIEGRYKYLG